MKKKAARRLAARRRHKQNGTHGWSPRGGPYYPPVVPTYTFGSAPVRREEHPGPEDYRDRRSFGARLVGAIAATFRFLDPPFAPRRYPKTTEEAFAEDRAALESDRRAIEGDVVSSGWSGPRRSLFLR